MLALLPLLLGLVKGAALGPLLAGLSVPQWLGIANGLLTIAPKARAEFSALHDVFQKMNDMADRGGYSEYDMAHAAQYYFVENPPDEVDRTQEDINQDERMDKIEDKLDSFSIMLTDLEARVRRLEHDH